MGARTGNGLYAAMSFDADELESHRHKSVSTRLGESTKISIKTQ